MLQEFKMIGGGLAMMALLGGMLVGFLCNMFVSYPMLTHFYIIFFCVLLLLLLSSMFTVVYLMLLFFFIDSDLYMVYSDVYIKMSMILFFMLVFFFILSEFLCFPWFYFTKGFIMEILTFCIYRILLMSTMFLFVSGLLMLGESMKYFKMMRSLISIVLLCLFMLMMWNVDLSFSVFEHMPFLCADMNVMFIMMLTLLYMSKYFIILGFMFFIHSFSSGKKKM